MFVKCVYFKSFTNLFQMSCKLFFLCKLNVMAYQCQMSNVMACQMSNVIAYQCQMSWHINVKFQMSWNINAKCQMSKFKSQMIKYQMHNGKSVNLVSSQ